MKLVIVESPAKAKTISRFLGNEYKVVASYGHIRDLPNSASEVPLKIKEKPWARMAVDIDDKFTPYYVIPTESKKRVAELKKMAKEADEIVLATDEDREGESISWHLLEILKPKVPVRRIVFHEVTKSAIDEAISAPRDVDNQLVRAQESRRILDRLYGYSLSPVLWKKVGPNLSAGRVQSVAVRLVVEQEEARRAFHKAEYWDIEAQLSAENTPFKATLISLGGQRLAAGKDFDANTGMLKTKNVIALLGDDAKRVCEALKTTLPWQVARLEQKQTRQRPAPPFITSTLQQAASSLLNMSPAQTMRTAQYLYEGVDMGGGEREGLITYMRTDSVTLSNKALQDAEQLIRQEFGDRYFQGARRYTTKSKSAQEAHEAIRPTDLSRSPESLRGTLGKDELNLYRLIWNRTLASQMADAELLKTTVDFVVSIGGDGEAVLRANGSVVDFPGYLKVADTSQKDTQLPPLQEGWRVGPGEPIQLEKAEPLRHETQPPARFTEASLVRRLEEEGIGRPSTYAPTISTIQNRGYVVKRGNTLVPTFKGIAVIMLLRKHFQDFVDLKFTARMEDVLDDIAQGDHDWVDFLSHFYYGEGQFGNGLVKTIESELPEIEFPAIQIGEDPENGDSYRVRLGRNGAFLQRGEGGSENIVSLPEDTTYDELTEEMAAGMFEAKARGNEGLGVEPESGQKVYALVGPYGPYVQLGEADKEAKTKPKRVSLPKGTEITQVTLETALDYLSLPRELGVHPESGDKITTAIGRFGPYVKCGSEFRSLPKEDSVFSITLERALELLAQPKRSRQTKELLRELGKTADGEQTVSLFKGRYGPYISDGTVNASLPKDMDPDELNLDMALNLLANAPAAKKKRPAKKKAAAKKAPAKKTAAKKTAAKKKSSAS